MSQPSNVSTKTKAIRGMVSLVAGTTVGRGLRLVRNMILVRLLAPEQFGLMAVVLAATSAFESLTEVGVEQSVIQNKIGADPEYLNVAWWFQLIRGLVLFTMGFLAAPWIASFYGNTELLMLLRVSFISMLFRGLVSPRTYVLQKQYKFGLLVFVSQSSSILGIVSTVILAFTIKNVWALVIGFVAEYAILCVLSYVFVPFKPTFKINRAYLGELLKFTRGMFGLPLLTMIASQSDVFFLGKLVSTVQLGMYTLALKLAEQPASIFGQVIGVVLLPVFAEGQDQSEILRRRVLRVIRTTLIVSVPLIVIVVIGAKPIISLIYTPKYAVVTVPFIILCIAMFVKSQAMILVTICMAVGKPHIQRRYAVLLAACVVCLMYPGITMFGVAGAAGVLLLSHIVAICLQIVWVGRLVDLRFRDYIFWRRPTCAPETSGHTKISENL